MDASIALAALLPDERSSEARRSLRLLESATALVPPVWELEVANVLVVAERRGQLDPGSSERIVAGLSALGIVERKVPANLARYVKVARDNDLTTYDASYLMLADFENVPLATLDGRLRKACAAVGVDALQP